MICLISCKHNTSMIALPEGCGVEAGRPIACPENCPGKCSSCSASGMFVPTGIWRGNKAQAPDAHPVRYSKAQRNGVWGIPTESRGAVSIARGVSCDPTMKFWYTGEAERLRVTEFLGDVVADSDQETDGELLRPKSTAYNSFFVGVKPFSDDPMLRKAMNARPLQGALTELFSYWNVSAVFKNDNELKDEFVWLLTKTAKTPIQKREVDAIVQRSSYTVSQKFFYLFYRIVFRDMPQRAFYWCGQRMARFALTPIFQDKKDFVTKYFDAGEVGRQFREFYAQQKEEIHFFLGIQNEQLFFDELMQSLLREKGQIYFFEKKKGYQPVCLGTIAQFIKDMQVFTTPERMAQMVSFLEAYCVSPQGITPRERSLRFTLSGEGETPEVYGQVAPGCKSRKAFEAYLVLLCEYLSQHKPKEIVVGGLRLTKEKFGEEADALVKEYCKQFLDGTDREALQKCEGQARLAKCLYERGILEGFSVGDEGRLKKTFGLLGDMDIDVYLALYPDPLIQANGREMSLRDYIVWKADVAPSKLKNSLGKDTIISAILAKRVTVNARNILVEISKEYERIYRDVFRRYS